jgi:subtilisin family serine protease
MNNRRAASWLLITLLAFLVAPLFLSTLARADSVATADTYLPIAHMPPTPTPIPAPPVGRVVPNDPLFYLQWPLNQIRAQEAWRITTGAPVIIAVIDTGVDYTHPDLRDKMTDPASWYDFVNNDHDPIDDHGHGTHVAGIAAAASNNNAGISGVAWGAKIMPLKALRENGTGPVSQIAAAIDHATDNGAHVINLSLGISTPLPPTHPWVQEFSATLRRSIERAREHGLVLVASAGNDHSVVPDIPDPWSYPAAMDGVIAVGATNSRDTHASYSTVAQYLDVVAPGGDGTGGVYSTFPGGVYRGIAGTSMAAPHVSGLAALILGMRPALGPGEVATIIRSTATDLGEPGWDPMYGFGRIDMRRALEETWYVRDSAQDLDTGVTASPQQIVAATDCRLDHVESHVLVLRSPEGRAAREAVLRRIQHRMVLRLADWEALEVPAGRACQLVQALNNSGYGIVAELDIIMSIPELQGID